MILTMDKYHEDLLRDSPLSLLSIVKFFSSLGTKKFLKISNETFLRITRYLSVCSYQYFSLPHPSHDLSVISFFPQFIDNHIQLPINELNCPLHVCITPVCQNNVQSSNMIGIVCHYIISIH